MEQQENIAIVGIACKFPGAENKEQFWKNLLEGKESIKRFSEEELTKTEYNYNELKNNPNYVNARGVLEGIDLWDAGFFNMIPKDAQVMDPQHRLWLENTWHAFEDAGYNPFKYSGLIGVFTGSYLNTYLLNNILRDPEKYELYIRGRTPELFQAYINSDPMFLATKTAYSFNLKGPAINVQTACSTSLVAISQACTSLLSFESDMCVAGGVSIVVPQETGYLYQEGAISSPDGKCRPFDINSNGTTFGNGVGTVILKRLSDAISDNDRIYAVINGWGLNNDGNEKIGFSAPGIEGQSKAILMAYDFAGINAENIAYIEAHGTGTPLGDPIEIAALSKVFRKHSPRKQFCGIGSVKSNIGHLDAAAGVAGLIKVALSAYHGVVPATINFDAPNPRINIEKTPFYVVNKPLELKKDSTSFMGVSSFGIGGTNAHILLSNHKKPHHSLQDGPDGIQLITLSAKSGDSLSKSIVNLSEYLKTTKESIANIAYTLNVRRAPLNNRAFALLQKDRPISPDDFLAHESNEFSKEITFLFPGQGTQYTNMGKGLYEKNDLFNKQMDECFSIYENITGGNLKEIIYNDGDPDQKSKLSQTQYTQPALFSVEYSIAKLLMHYSLSPNYMLGHSIGEYTAACISGVFDLETAMKIVIRRGELMQSAPKGSMMAIRSNIDKLLQLKSEYFEVAAENSDNACTISFQENKRNDIVELLNSNEIDYKELDTSHAFHSSSFDGILKEFSDFVKQQRLNPPLIPFISCVTGKEITTEQALSGDYWASQLRTTVNYRKGISTLAEGREIIYIECGPNTHLSGLTKQIGAVKDKTSVLSTIGKADNKNEAHKIFNTLGNLWIRGYGIDFNIWLKNHKGIPVDGLPAYAFDKKSYWIEHTMDKVVKNTNAELKSNIKKGATRNSEPQSPLSKIRAILAEQSGFQEKDIKENVKFEDLGLDSLFLAQFARNLEKRYKINVEFRKIIYEYPTLSTMSQYIQENSPVFQKKEEPQTKFSANEGENFIPIKTSGKKSPLVVVHGDDMNHFLPPALNGDRPMYGYLHLGADGKRIKFSNVQQMAKNYVQQLLNYDDSGEYLLAGFSFGGSLAFEMANQLIEMGRKVPVLILIDCASPAARIKASNIIITKPRKFKKAEGLSKFLLKNYYRAYYVSHRIKMNSFFYFGLRLPVRLRKNYTFDKYSQLSRKYVTSNMYSGKTYIMRASENESDMEYLGWDELTTNISDTQILRGDHESILKNEDSIEKIKELINEYIE